MILYIECVEARSRVRLHGGMCIPVHATMAKQNDIVDKQQRCTLHLCCVCKRNKEDLNLLSQFLDRYMSKQAGLCCPLFYKASYA